MFPDDLGFPNFTRTSSETEPSHNEVEGEALLSCDTITNISRQSSLKFIIESVHNVGFYELFILRSHIARLQMKDKIYGMTRVVCLLV